jgi:hypothetical protein
MQHLIRVFCAALLMGGAAHAVAQDAAPQDVLRPLTTCAFGDQLQAARVEHRSPAPPWRSVQTATGPLQVSVADGYRMLLGYPDSAPFVNLKLERSQPGMLARDRDAILAQMRNFAALPGAAVAPLQVVARNGIEIMALNGHKLDGDVVGIYTLISAKHDVVATAYLLNAEPARRKFKTVPQYRAARDDFIFALALCMAEL